MSYLSKNVVKLALILVAIVGCLLIVSMKPSLSHVGLVLSGQAQGQQKIEFYYLEKSEAKGIAYRDTQDLSQPRPYYFSYPRHFTPDRVVIDLGDPPSSWVVESVTLYVDFLIFGFDGYQWDMRAIESMTKPIESSTVFRFDDKFHIDAVKEPGRLNFRLDYAKARPTVALIIAKIVGILVFLGLIALFWSGYLWRLFKHREVDLTALESCHALIRKQKKPWLLTSAVLLVIVLLYFTLPHFQSPGLHIEDTMEFSDLSNGNTDLLQLDTYNYYRGYTVLINEWFAAASEALFPLAWQPRIYLLLACILLSIAVIVAARSGIFSSKLVLTIAPTVLFFGAFTDPAFYLTLTGTLFSSTALLMAMALRPPPSSLANLTWYIPVVTILAFSGPYGSVLLPLSVALILFFGTRRNFLLLTLIAVLAVLYILSAQSGMVQFSNIVDPNIRMAFFRYLVEHILLLGLFPDIDYPIGFLIVSIATALLITYRRDTLFVKMSLIFIATSLASFISYFLSYKFHQYAGEVISSHTVISQFCWLLFVLLCVDRVASSLPPTLFAKALTVPVVIAFAGAIVVKQGIVADHVVLAPDPQLKSYITALEYAKKHPTDDSEFLQLWYVNPLGFISSYRKGKGPEAVSKNDLPDFVQPFHLAQNLDRKRNSMLIYDRKKSIINVSVIDQMLPAISVPKPAH